MSKNIILCSDGTGKAGGAILNTNVFQLYKAVDTQNTTQIAYYDDGIGSKGLGFMRLLSGAFGFGFQKNVLNLYGYLARHYEPGDKIFFFGFSRGAATVRAAAGMIQRVGLLKKDSKAVTTSGRLDRIKFTIECLKALRLYKRSEKYKDELEDFKTRKTHGSVDIEMVGAWDTVEALGFPKDSSWLVIGLSMLIDKVTNVFFPHRYYEFQLDKNVKHAYHALAIDDERKSFHPNLWNENDTERPQHIEQVWFAGGHSNVGGGLERTGLSMITLDWMMERAASHGVVFNPNLWSDVKDGMNPGGSLPDSRRGIMGYYRYSPRHIRDISETMVEGNIKIHDSVFERISLRRYAPVFPNKFEIVGTKQDQPPIVYEVGVDDVKKLKSRINMLHKIRTVLYHVITELTLFTAILVWYFSSSEFDPSVNSRLYNGFMTLVPSTFENFLYFAFVQHTWFGMILTFLFAAAFGARHVAKVFTIRTGKKINWWLFHDFK